MQEIDIIFDKLLKNNKSLGIELNYVNNFTLLIAILLSAQATDKIVNRATESLFKEYDTPEKIILLGFENLLDYIKIIGLYKTKAKNIISLCRILIKEYASCVPDNFEDLIKLPGVGRKTANVYLSNVHNMPLIGVDTHVYRVAHRIGLASSKSFLKTELELYKIIPQNYLPVANSLLVLHGRYVCTAKKPQCEKCCINKECKKIFSKDNKIGD